MEPSRKPRVKICCIANIREAWLAIDHGASALGLVSEMPSGPGVIPEEAIAEIARILPPAVTSVLLTSKQEPSAIIAQHKRCGTNAIQLCDRLKIEDYKMLKKAMPGIGLIQVIHVTGKEAIEDAVTIAPHVNAILLDSGNERLTIKQLGGTGRIHDWKLSAQIRQKVSAPVFLAGGLDSANVAEALKQVHPFAVDVCNGVRTDGKLDDRKLSAFFKAVSIYTSRTCD
jgi:phosphoribosylanthranilate isomerase